MTTVFVRDELRASIEAATGGQCTVHYTANGLPSYFAVIPKFNVEDIDPSLGSGTHPAFVINGVEVSRIFIGLHTGIVKSGELLSLPGVAPTASISLEDAAAAARNCGAGFHLMTNAEWAAIALYCYKNGWLPDGNSDMGRNYFAAHEAGVRVDGLAPGTSTGTGTTVTGSGPCSWRHNNAPNGISDMVGNLREWVGGVRLVEGELQVLANNDAAALQGSFHTSDAWKAVLFTTGALVAPGTAGTVKMNSGAVASGNPPQNVGPFGWANAITNKIGPDGSSAALDYNGAVFSAIEAGGPALLKTLALSPLGEMDHMGNAYGRNYGTRYFSRGERHTAAPAAAGIFAFDVLDATGTTHFYTGARVAKY